MVWPFTAARFLGWDAVGEEAPDRKRFLKSGFVGEAVTAGALFLSGKKPWSVPEYSALFARDYGRLMGVPYF
jgi:hypothetical protein